MRIRYDGKVEEPILLRDCQPGFTILVPHDKCHRVSGTIDLVKIKHISSTKVQIKYRNNYFPTVVLKNNLDADMMVKWIREPRQEELADIDSRPCVMNNTLVVADSSSNPTIAIIDLVMGEAIKTIGIRPVMLASLQGFELQHNANFTLENLKNISPKLIDTKE